MIYTLKFKSKYQKILKTLVLFIIAAFSISSYSCGAGDASQIEFQDSKNFNVAADKAWNSVLDLMDKEKYVIYFKNIDYSMSRPHFSVGYDYKLIPVDKIYEYTTTHGGDYIGFRQTIFIEVFGDSSNSTITINTEYEGAWRKINLLNFSFVDRGFQGAVDQELYSNGRFELEFFKKMEELLYLY
jgi:hypothetical protein